MWCSMRLVAASFVMFLIGVSPLQTQQPLDTVNTRESPAGKIAWQYDTGG
jgi:hypothetical protein